MPKTITIQRLLDPSKYDKHDPETWHTEPETVKAVVRGKLALHQIPDWCLTDKGKECAAMYRLSHVPTGAAIADFKQVKPLAMRHLLNDLQGIDWSGDYASFVKNKAVSKLVRQVIGQFQIKHCR